MNWKTGAAFLWSPIHTCPTGNEHTHAQTWTRSNVGCFFFFKAGESKLLHHLLVNRWELML